MKKLFRVFEHVFCCSCEGTEKVLALHQERIVRLPSCPTSDLCDYDELLKFYKNDAAGCDFNEMCHIETGETDEENTDDAI